MYRTSGFTTPTIESDITRCLCVFFSYSLFSGQAGCRVTVMYVNLPFLPAFGTLTPLQLPTDTTNTVERTPLKANSMHSLLKFTQIKPIEKK